MSTETVVERVIIGEIIREPGPVETVVEREIVTELVTETVGPPGPPGPRGPAGEAYTHTQASASATWTVAHNLGFRPSVTTLSTGGVRIEGSVTHLSTDVALITFAIPIAGSAHLV